MYLELYMLRSKSGIKGFSLIELLVVVAIIGVLATVGTIAYQSYVDNTKQEVSISNTDKIHRAFSQDYIALLSDLGGQTAVGDESIEGYQVNRHDTCLKYIDKSVENINIHFKNAYDDKIVYAVNLHREAYEAFDFSPPRSPRLQAGQIGLLCADACAAVESTRFYMRRCSCTGREECILDDYATDPSDWIDNGLSEGYIGVDLPQGVCPVPEAVQPDLDCEIVMNNQHDFMFQLASLTDDSILDFEFLFAQLGIFITGDHGSGSAISPSNSFSHSLDDAVRAYGYENYNTWLLARDLGYAETEEDANRWRMANGYDSNPYADDTAIFTVPGSYPEISLTVNQYEIDCQYFYTGRQCSELTREQFSNVIAHTNTAIYNGFVSYEQQKIAENNGWTDIAEWNAAKFLGYSTRQLDYDLYQKSKLNTGTTEALCTTFNLVGTVGTNDCSKIMKDDYEQAQILYNHGWSAVDWNMANDLGYTSSTDDFSLFSNAKLDTTNESYCDLETGSITGTGSCATIYKTAYNEILSGNIALINILADVSSGDILSENDILSVLDAANVTAPSITDYTNTLHLRYITHCVAGFTNQTIQNVAMCVTSMTSSKIAVYNVGLIVTDSSYSTDHLTVQTLEDVNVQHETISIIEGHYCGIDADASCLTGVRNNLNSSGLTVDSSNSDVITWVNNTVQTLMTEVADNTTIPGNSAVTTACTSAVNVSIPSSCSHPHWDCSLTTAPSGWIIQNNNLVIPANVSAYTGEMEVVIRMALQNTGYFKDVNKTYEVLATISGSVSGKRRYNMNSEFDIQAAHNFCVAKGGRLATKSEHNSLGTTDYYLFNSSETAGLPEYTETCHTVYMCTSENTCHTNYHVDDQKTAKSSSNAFFCGGATTTSLVYYSCADIDICE